MNTLKQTNNICYERRPGFLTRLGQVMKNHKGVTACLSTGLGISGLMLSTPQIGRDIYAYFCLPKQIKHVFDLSADIKLIGTSNGIAIAGEQMLYIEDTLLAQGIFNSKQSPEARVYRLPGDLQKKLYEEVNFSHNNHFLDEDLDKFFEKHKPELSLLAVLRPDPKNTSGFALNVTGTESNDLLYAKNVNDTCIIGLNNNENPYDNDTIVSPSGSNSAFDSVGRCFAARNDPLRGHSRVDNLYASHANKAIFKGDGFVSSIGDENLACTTMDIYKNTSLAQKSFEAALGTEYWIQCQESGDTSCQPKILHPGLTVVYQSRGPKNTYVVDTSMKNLHIFFAKPQDHFLLLKSEGNMKSLSYEKAFSDPNQKVSLPMENIFIFDDKEIEKQACEIISKEFKNLTENNYQACLDKYGIKANWTAIKRLENVLRRNDAWEAFQTKSYIVQHFTSRVALFLKQKIVADLKKEQGFTKE